MTQPSKSTITRRKDSNIDVNSRNINHGWADADHPTTLRLNLLAAEAERQGLLSEGQLARLLRLNRVELREILNNHELQGSEGDGSSTALTDPAAQLIADVSTIINLIATGNARAIVSTLPNRVVVVDVVPGELETGRARGREACDRLEELVTAAFRGTGHRTRRRDARRRRGGDDRIRSGAEKRETDPRVVLDLTATKTTVTGTLTMNGQSVPIGDGNVSKNTFTFTVTRSDRTEGFTGELAGDQVTVWMDRLGLQTAGILKRVTN